MATKESDHSDEAVQVVYADDNLDECQIVTDELEERLDVVDVRCLNSRTDAISTARKITEGEISSVDCFIVEHDIADNRTQFVRELSALVRQTPLLLYTRVGAGNLEKTITDAVTSIARKGTAANRRFMLNKVQTLADDGGEKPVRKQLEKVLDTQTGALFIVNEDGTVIHGNKPVEQMLSADEDIQTAENLRATLERVFTNGATYRERFDRTANEEAVDGYLAEISATGQTDRHFECWSWPAPAELPGSRIEFYREITKYMHQHEQTKKLETVTELSDDILQVLNSRGEVEYANQSFYEKFYYETHHAVVGMGDGALQAGQQAVQQLIESDEQEGELIEQELITEWGEKITVESHFALLFNESGNFDGIINVARDISDRKKREERLEQYRTLVETSDDPMYVLDKEGRIEILNNAVAEYGEADKSDMVGAYAGHGVAEDAVRRAEQAIESLVKNDEKESETVRVWFDHEGGDRHLLEATYSILEEDNEYVGSVAVFRNITEHHRQEQQLKESEEKLKRQNEKLEQFVNMVTHHLRNPLGIAELHLDIAADTGDEEHYDEVEQALDHLDNMIERLLTYARMGGSSFERDTCNVQQTVMDAWESTETEHASLQVLTDKSWTVSADCETFGLVLENLFRNAVVHNDSPVTVTVGPIPEDETKQPTGIFIADDGQGLPDAESDIFDHGFTTAEDGAGLGLSIVTEGVSNHDWTLDTTDEGAGARFEISEMNIKAVTEASTDD